MSKQLIARGQATILVQKDSYTIQQSVSEYIFTANNNGTIPGAVTFTSTIKVTLGDDNVTNFSIGAITKPAGFTAITVNNTNKTITYSVAANTAGMADSGIVAIPILIGGQTFTLSFSYAKAKTGVAGIDSNMLDWVKDWNTRKTVIGSESLITPKIFAGVKNANNTITGIAIGKFALSTVNASGVVATETVNGIYGFKEGNKTFILDTGGNVQLGRGNQFVKYNAATGKIEFGSEVTLNWVNAINTAKTEAINSAAMTAQAKADAAKNAAISAAATDATNKVSALEVGGDNVLPNGDFSYYSTNNAIGWNNALNGTYVMSDWGSGYNNGVSAPSAGYHTHLNLTKFGFPVLELVNKNSTIGQTRRWLGIATAIYQKERLVPGAKYTFSADVMSDTSGAYINGGVYSTKKGQTNANFSSGQYVLAPGAVNKWERVSYTFTLDSDADLTKPLAFYIYSYSGTEGICWVKNASLQRGTKGCWTRCNGDVAKDVADAKQAGTDAKSVADAITNKASTEEWSTKLTYIGSTGIFTGTLSANIVNALRINASQITAGVIDAARINVESLKSSLITTGNIEALTLNVTKGKIGGWSLDTDSIFRGTKNNTTGGYTTASGAVTIGSNGIRGFKWRLDGTGAGALAGGNISWDASGTVTFAASVSLNWTNPIASITTALGGGSFPKLTYISGTGIYTGTLTAQQVNAVAISAASITTGTLSADRIGAKAITAAKIAAGTITAAEINVASIQASVVTATAVNGLTCTFAKGTIGGWNINSSQIYKNSVYLGSDGSITNSTKWQLKNDGSGQIANGNISWNAAGAVTFSPSVSLNWTNAIENAKTTNYGYRYYKRIVINGESGKYYPVVIKGGDQTVKRDLLVRRGYSEQGPADWESNSTTHIGGLTLLIKTNFGGWGGSTYSWDIYELSETYAKMFAGAAFCGNSCMFALFLRGGGSTGAVYHLYSDQPIESDLYSPSPIPHSPQIAYNSDLIFKSPKGSTDYYLEYAPAPRTLTIEVEDEIRKRRFILLAQNSASTLSEHPLTYIGATGIYTGTLTAVQVNAVAINASSITTGTLSADRIAAGSIRADKLDAATIKSQIINTSYINGLSCSFTTGTIGGWSIGADHITKGTVGSVGGIPIQIRSASSGSGYWYGGAYKPYGISIMWHQAGNAGHIVFGQVAASGNSVKAGFIGIQMMGWDNTEYFCLSANYTRSGSKEVYNRIAGWAFDTNSIYKNNVYLGSDGSISNGMKWRLGNDGSGRLANGNIAWDASGNVTFGSAVSLNWTNAATGALNSAKSYADTKKTEAISAAATDATAKANAAKELASAMAFGRMLYRDPEFRNGNNGINVYNNSGNGTVTITRTGLSSAPNDSKMVLEIRTTGSASPANGGFHFGNICSNRKVFITKIIAKIPVGRNLQWASNSIGTSGSSKWLTPNAGTGDWQEYIYKVTCGTSNFSSTNFFNLDGTQGTAASPVVWHVAYATVFDTTASERYTTTIDADGVYTGTVRANQVLIDSALVVGGSSYNGSISVRDAGNNVMVTLDRSGITAVAGSIGGWSIKSGSIYATAPAGGHRVYITDSGYIYNDDGTQDYWGLRADGSATFGYGKILFDNDGSGYVANQNIKWDAKGNVTIKGNITANSGLIAGFTISGNKLVNTAADSSIEFTSLMGNASLTINSYSALLSLRADSARTGIYIQTYATNAVGLNIIANAGSKYAIESYGPVQLGQRSNERWCVPGVLYIGEKYMDGWNNYITKIWGDGLTITRCDLLDSACWRFTHNLNHTNYAVLTQMINDYNFLLVKEKTSTYFTIQQLTTSGRGEGDRFYFFVVGKNTW